jgi:hypothetical protein
MGAKHRLQSSGPRAVSFDHLVGERQQLVWNLEAQRLGGPEVDHSKPKFDLVIIAQ